MIVSEPEIVVYFLLVPEFVALTSLKPALQMLILKTQIDWRNIIFLHLVYIWFLFINIGGYIAR